MRGCGTRRNCAREGSAELPSPSNAAPDQSFDDQLGTMIAAREDGLIAGIGLSNITREQLLHALRRTEIVCVQNAFNLFDRSSQALLDECTARGIAFVPFYPLGSGFPGAKRWLAQQDGHCRLSSATAHPEHPARSTARTRPRSPACTPA